jgi:predicted alpha/beta-hydrolase family hydrolase
MTATGRTESQDRDARALYVFAHGVGAGMQHAGMSSLADALAAASVATLRYQFPYMERGSKRVDSPAVAHAAVWAAVAEARRRVPALPLFAGGRSRRGVRARYLSSPAQVAYCQPGCLAR